ncbi:MAG: hypothetical protein E7660_03830 [Ruminococcaceae bacterium]|nr:hypothetical protein [Oscillospiraceae bacterium]
MDELKKIIYDHDLGSDCDDAGALAILIKAHKAKRCKALAITCCIADKYSAPCTDAICQYFGVSDIPIGRNLENDKHSAPCYHDCTKVTCEKWYGDKPMPEHESNVKLLRRILAENGKKDITFITTGPLTTVFELFRSGADEISPKSGRELFAENVTEFVCGAGNFTGDRANREWNIRADSESAVEVINRPATPITFVGNNVGGCIFTGNKLPDCDERYPVRECYYLLWNYENCVRNSWDLVTVYYGIYGGGGFWDVAKGYDVTVNALGQTRFSEGGIHSYLYQSASSEVITAVLDEFMMP